MLLKYQNLDQVVKIFIKRSKVWLSKINIIAKDQKLDQQIKSLFLQTLDLQFKKMNSNRSKHIYTVQKLGQKVKS